VNLRVLFYYYYYCCYCYYYYAVYRFNSMVYLLTLYIAYFYSVFIYLFIHCSFNDAFQ